MNKGGPGQINIWDFPKVRGPNIDPPNSQIEGLLLEGHAEKESVQVSSFAEAEGKAFRAAGETRRGCAVSVWVTRRVHVAICTTENYLDPSGKRLWYPAYSSSGLGRVFPGFSEGSGMEEIMPAQATAATEGASCLRNCV